jgi:flagellar protein FliS
MNPYDQYVENSIMTATPLQLVTMLYRCAIESLGEARRCLANGDIAGRAAPVTKAFDAVTELLISLDSERGGEMGRQLAELYCYIQQRLLVAHCEQSDEKFAEVERLLSTMLESWQQIAAENRQPENVPPPAFNRQPISISY